MNDHLSSTELEVWPNCVVPDCPNKSDLPNEKCYPHHHFGDSAPPNLMHWTKKWREGWLRRHGFNPDDPEYQRDH